MATVRKIFLKLVGFHLSPESSKGLFKPYEREHELCENA